MISPEVARAQAQLAAIKKEEKDLSDLRNIQRGLTRPGTRPDLLARAVRDSIPLPIKYTQSIESLRSLYKYSLESKDTKLYFWSCSQISRLYSKQILNAIESEIPRTVPRPTPKKTYLDVLREERGNISPNGLKKFAEDGTKAGEIPPFFAKQLKRCSEANNIIREIRKTAQNEHQLFSTTEMLREAFLNQDYVRKNDALYPTKICDSLNVSRLISVSALIEAQGPRFGFHEILHNELFTKKKMFKTKLAIPKAIILKKITPYRPYDEVINKIEEIGD